MIFIVTSHMDYEGYSIKFVGNEEDALEFAKNLTSGEEWRGDEIFLSSPP